MPYNLWKLKFLRLSMQHIKGGLHFRPNASPKQFSSMAQYYSWKPSIEERSNTICSILLRKWGIRKKAHWCWLAKNQYFEQYILLSPLLLPWTVIFEACLWLSSFYDKIVPSHFVENFLCAIILNLHQIIESHWWLLLSN